MYKRQAHSKGFTLVELLIVITIIAVLASLLFANFAGARERARDIKRKNDLQQVKKALRLYYNDFQNYPTEGASHRIHGCGAAAPATSDCAWGSAFSLGTTIYMGALPQPPTTAETYDYYDLGANTDGFLLVTVLENNGDQDIARSQTACAASITASGVTTPLEEGTYLVCAE